MSSYIGARLRTADEMDKKLRDIIQKHNAYTYQFAGFRVPLTNDWYPGCDKGFFHCIGTIFELGGNHYEVIEKYETIDPLVGRCFQINARQIKPEDTQCAERVPMRYATHGSFSANFVHY